MDAGWGGGACGRQIRLAAMVDLWWRDTESVGWLTVCWLWVVHGGDGSLQWFVAGLLVLIWWLERMGMKAWREMLRFGKSVSARFEEINLGLRLRIGAENMGLGGRIWEITLIRESEFDC
ncbi:hypothetical protein D5086_003450 [Populus alba]|uniref:Uncharacterized protein n=1 Tax=Populus alba TaxID=43335 RepID=A0ACC4D5I2_POPAL